MFDVIHQRIFVLLLPSHRPRMANFFTLPELTSQLASHLRSSVGLSNLSQCSRPIYQTVTPILYRNLEFSIYMINLLHRTLEENPTLAEYCRRLSVTMSMSSVDSDMDIVWAFPTKHIGKSMRRMEEARQAIRVKLHFILRQCSKHGNLKSFLWNSERNETQFPVQWLIYSSEIWENLSLSSTSLKEIQIISDNESDKLESDRQSLVSVNVSSRIDCTSAVIKYRPSD